MSEVTNRIANLAQAIQLTYENLKIDESLKKLKNLQTNSLKVNFWHDKEAAKKTMKEIADLQMVVSPWVDIKQAINELSELDELNDQSLLNEIKQTFDELSAKYENMKYDLAFTGIYDNHDVILSIYAGAGGTDAQDWAGMLLRMYTRWVESVNGKVELLEQSVGEEAGIKSATLSVSLPYAYGKLKGEHGVHRLVRLSPFNSDNLRQTSFAKVDIVPLIDKPNEVEIDDKDIKIDVYRSGGHGGQSVNTTDSAVRVSHVPTGITVSIQNERSQLQNKETALTILRSKLAQLQLEQHKERISDLKGPSQSAEWGNQIRSYVLHPYKQVKDLRTKYETSDPEKILNGDLNFLIQDYIEANMGSQP